MKFAPPKSSRGCVFPWVFDENLELGGANFLGRPKWKFTSIYLRIGYPLNCFFVFLMNDKAVFLHVGSLFMCVAVACCCCGGGDLLLVFVPSGGCCFLMVF